MIKISTFVLLIFVVYGTHNFKRDVALVHCKLAMALAQQGASWDPQRANHHFNQSIHSAPEDKGKAFYLYVYARWLTKTEHQCGNHNCTKKVEKRCKRCKNIHYCSSHCQRSHWQDQHYLDCNDNSSLRVKTQNYEKAQQYLLEAMRLESTFGFTNADDKGEIIGINYTLSKRSIYSQSALCLADIWVEKHQRNDDARELLKSAVKVETDSMTKAALSARRMKIFPQNESDCMVERRDTLKCFASMLDDAVQYQQTMGWR